MEVIKKSKVKPKIPKKRGIKPKTRSDYGIFNIFIHNSFGEKFLLEFRTFKNYEIINNYLYHFRLVEKDLPPLYMVADLIDAKTESYTIRIIVDPDLKKVKGLINYLDYEDTVIKRNRNKPII